MFRQNNVVAREELRRGDLALDAVGKNLGLVNGKLVLEEGGLEDKEDTDMKYRTKDTDVKQKKKPQRLTLYLDTTADCFHT
jgi:hypothetical protein